MAPVNPKKYLNEVYDLKDLDSTKDFYRRWAESYEREVADGGYITPQRCDGEIGRKFAGTIATRARCRLRNGAFPGSLSATPDSKELTEWTFRRKCCSAPANPAYTEGHSFMISPTRCRFSPALTRMRSRREQLD